MASFFRTRTLISENEEDNASHSPDHEAHVFLGDYRKDAGKRRGSLAAKMTSNLRRLSGAPDLKVDINDPVSSNNQKYCNKKIKVRNFSFNFGLFSFDYIWKYVAIIFILNSYNFVTYITWVSSIHAIKPMHCIWTSSNTVLLLFLIYKYLEFSFRFSLVISVLCGKCVLFLFLVDIISMQIKWGN